MATNVTPEVLERFYPGGFCGFDIDGRPIFIEPLGRIDFQGILNSATPDEVLDFKRKQARELDNRCKKQEEKLGKTFEKRGVLLLDSEGGNINHLWKPGLTLYKSVLNMIENEFPNLYSKVLVINTPMIFPVIWGFLKPFLNHESREKTVIFGRNCKKELSKYINTESLPVHYGGTQVDKNGSPKCEEYICYGGKLPKTFFIQNINLMNQKFEGFESFDINPSEYHQITRIASPACESFKYQFVTCCSDIIFSVFLEEQDKLECVLKETKYEKMLLHEENIVCTKKRGTYLFQFCLPSDVGNPDKVYYTIYECSENIM